LLLCPLKKARVTDYPLTSAVVNLVTIRLFVAYDACFGLGAHHPFFQVLVNIKVIFPYLWGKVISTVVVNFLS